MKKISDYLNGISRKNYTEEEKKKILAYMKARKYLLGASTKKITDRVTGETVFSVCFHLYGDEEFEWNSSEIYHLEQYDLALTEEFIQHVLINSTQTEKS